MRSAEVKLVDHLPLGRDNENAVVIRALLPRPEHEIVENGVLKRHGDMILHLEPYGLPEILGLRTREVEQPRHHLLVGDADDNGSSAERVRFPELPDLGSQKIVIGDLALDHSPTRQPMVSHVLEDVFAPAAGDLDGLDRAAVYVHPDSVGPKPPETLEVLHAPKTPPTAGRAPLIQIQASLLAA